MVQTEVTEKLQDNVYWTYMLNYNFSDLPRGDTYFNLVGTRYPTTHE